MKGNVTNTGYWPDSPDRNNDFNIIPSNEITMEGMDMPLMGISNKGDKKLMLPGKNYKFKGETVMETPIDKGMFLGRFKQVGGQLVPHDISVPNLSRQDGGGLESIFKQMMPTYGSQPGVIEQVKAIPNQMLEGMNNKEYNPSEEYMKALMLQENENNAGLRDNKYYPYDSVEGGTPTIGYGHKLTEAEVKAKKYSSGLTKEEVDKLMRNDLNRHKTVAQSSFEKQYGKGSFNKLPGQLKDIVVDYSYTGTGVNEFPNFHKSVYEYSTANDPAIKQAAYNNMLAQHKRYTKGQELVKRNAYTEQVLKKLKQDGGENEMPFGLPLKEQNIYTLPEYNQPRNPKTGEILPDPRRPNLGMGTGATEYKTTIGYDEGDVDAPMIVSGQYIGPQGAIDRYELTGERFKTMTDPGSYSNFYEQIGRLGLMQEKHGGSVKRVKIKSLPNNWKTQ